MKLKPNGRTRNLIACVTLILVIIIVISTIYIGNQQDAVFSNNSQNFQAAQAYLQQNPTYSLELYQQLLTTHADSYLLWWDAANALSAQGNYRQAAQYYAKAAQLRPIIISDQQFLLPYSQALYSLGQYSKAHSLLIHAFPNQYSDNNDPVITQKVKSLLQAINDKLGNTVQEGQ